MGTELIKLFVPENILQHFEYEKLDEMSAITHIHLVEKKTLIANKSLNREERKEHAMGAMKKKFLASLA